MELDFAENRNEGFRLHSIPLWTGMTAAKDGDLHWLLVFLHDRCCSHDQECRRHTDFVMTGNCIHAIDAEFIHLRFPLIMSRVRTRVPAIARAIARKFKRTGVA